MIKNRTARPFGFRDKLGYLFGDFGNDFTFILSTMLLLKFYTDVMGISGAVVGTVMMVARFADAFTDVTMGRICDRSPVTKQGKFKPWLRKICLPVAFSSFLIYQSSLAAAPEWLRIAWLTVTYLLWGSVFYTAVNIPYGSMASAISPDPSDRQSLSTYRTMGGTLAGLIIGVGVPLFAYEKAGDQTVLRGDRVTVAAGIFSALSIVCYLLCYFLVTERVLPEAPKEKRQYPSVGKMLANALKNRALISITLASVVMLLAQLTMQNMASYLYPDYYNNAAAASVSTLSMMGGMVAAAAVAKPLAKRFGKAEISSAANLFAAGICLLLFFLRPGSVWVYIGFQSLCWLGLGIFSMVNWALITDVIDDAELKNGIREDGSVYALYSFARKLGQALAAGASGWLLTAIGYDRTAVGTGTPQPEPVLRGIFTISTLIPALGFAALGLILWLWYPLRRHRVESNVDALKAKHEKKK